jgi:hypothetical protein
MLLAGGIAVLLVAWRTVLALGDADRTGSWRTFWSVFFGGG